MPRETTLFMRIHKTAGEAIAKQVGDRLSPAVVCPARFEWQVRSLPAQQLRRFQFFQGHISSAALSAVCPRLQVFTMLRSPRERLLSCFFYWTQGAKNASSEFFDAISGLSLIEFLRSEAPIIRRATCDVQARLLAGGRFGDTNQQRQNVFGPGLSKTELADAALGALDRLAFVGITEHYETSLAAIFDLMGLGEPPSPERVNVTAHKPESYAELLTDPEIAGQLAELTEVDQIIYDAARRRLVSAVCL